MSQNRQITYEKQMLFNNFDVYEILDIFNLQELKKLEIQVNCII